VRSFLGRRTGVTQAQSTMDAAAQVLTEGGPDHYSAALDRWLALGGADLDERAATVAVDLGLGVDLDTPMTTLSGGQAARVGLAALLLSRYDALLLDEPTNDLDLDGLERLERFVTGLRSPVVIVSHDREFLSRTVTRVVELDLVQQQVGVYDGGYDAYLTERARCRQHAREAYDAFAETRAGLEARARTQRSWTDTGVRNARRKATDNDKIGRKFRAEATEKQAAKVSQTQRQIERLEVVEEPRKEWELRMSIAAAPRSGSVVAALRGAVVERGTFRLGPVDLALGWADRVVITGANGSGKSTLLGALLGRVPLAAGLAFGSAVPEWPESEVRTLLAKFGLHAAHVPRPAASLSPGERTRAALALLQARGVNLLVLDEPTNHLDLPAIEQLESALQSYSGTLLFVTHDRRMLDAVRTTRCWAIADGQVQER
jgi:ATPase subunit of ABC transporter with duplicated ATPase domains